MRLPPDFRRPGSPQKSGNDWYDADYDRILIEQSIAKQYGVLPSQQENLKYSDWYKMVSGLMHDTPLGQVVRVRSEADKEIIKNYTSDQRAIRDEWSHFLASRSEKKKFTKEDEADWYRQMANFEHAFASAFSLNMGK
jgi:hypothetical protein